MKVSLCAYLYDYSGNIVFNADMSGSDFTRTARRVSRTATLDGGCVIVDNGHTVSDATFNITPARMTKARADYIRGMVSRHSYLTLICEKGAFLGVVDRINESGKFQISFLVKQALV